MAIGIGSWPRILHGRRQQHVSSSKTVPKHGDFPLMMNDIGHRVGNAGILITISRLCTKYRETTTRKTHRLYVSNDQAIETRLKKKF